MDFFKNIKNFHNKFSFNIFAICGYIILLGFFVNFVQSRFLDSYAFLWQISFFNTVYLIIILASFIVYIFEKIFCFEIKKRFIINNNIICTMRYLGAFISLIYMVIIIILLFCCNIIL